LNFEINSDRLHLRPPSLEDVPSLFELMAVSSLTEFLSWEAHTRKETTEAVVKSLIDAQKNDKAYHWCVCLNEKVIGLVSLIDVRRQIRTWTINRAELSYWIGISHQGKGYATEASKLVLDFGFKNLGLHKIIIAHANENTQSEKICVKLNFKKYALEHDAFQKHNKWHNLIWYELINNVI
jgi:ribosomal-protein-alanine N-acetyltransferase